MSYDTFNSRLVQLLSGVGSRAADLGDFEQGSQGGEAEGEHAALALGDVAELARLPGNFRPPLRELRSRGDPLQLSLIYLVGLNHES